MYKWILNKREYHRLARHLPAKPAQDIPFCSISPFFSIFTYTWFGTKFLNPVRIQKLLIYQRFYSTHFLGWGTNWGSWDFCTLSPTSFTSRYLVNSQLIFHEIYIYKLYTLYPKGYAISSNILLEKFFL